MRCMANFYLIRDLAERKGLTLRDLALKMNKTEDGLQKLIKKGSTNTQTLEDISQILEVHPGYFFDKFSGDMFIKQDGTNNLIGNNNVINAQQTAEIEHLKALLVEKERLIQVLMSKQ